ncbi:MAG: thermonuclease family protein [Hyphomicrobiaceae bacterium]
MRALALAFAVVVLFAPAPGRAEPVSNDRVLALDGETIRIDGKQPDIRLVGFKTPDTTDAHCAKERELGEKAASRMRDLIRAGRLDFRPVACPCPAGTEGTEACNRGRKCGTLRVDGRKVGAILIRERLAVPFLCGLSRCPKTPRPWCG